MKRLILTAIVVLTSVASYSGNPLSFKGGDKKFFKTASGGALLEIIYAGATYDDKMALTEKFPDIDNKTKISYDGFVEEYMERAKKVPIVTNPGEARYKFTIKVSKIDQFINVMGFIPGPCIRVWGTFTVTDLTNNTTLLIIDIDEIDGGSAPTPDRAFNDTFGELGKCIAKFK